MHIYYAQQQKMFVLAALACLQSIFLSHFSLVKLKCLSEHLC